MPERERSPTKTKEAGCAGSPLLRSDTASSLFFFWISLCFVFLFSFCLFVCQRHDTPLSTVRYLTSVRSIIPHIPLPAANAIRWKSSSAVHDQRGDQRGQLLQALREGILCTCNELRIARVCLYGVVIFCLCFGVVTLPACQVPVWRGRCVYACMDACT